MDYAIAMSSPTPTVTVNGCTITGTRQPRTKHYPKPVDVFYGIPFATAERFRPAVGVSPERGGYFDASEPGSVQPTGFAEHPMAESPLRLNVFCPAAGGGFRDGAKLPVVVYVHGGAFNFGNALERDLASFVSWAEAGNVIAVGAAYRLGALGFPLLAGERDHDEDGDGDEDEDEDEEGGGARAVNLGLGDQRAAFEWVRRWVGDFGGDAEDVTMMGMSAGAHSIGHHMLRPEAPLAFHKAILESGAPTARSVFSPTHPRPVSQWRELLLCAGDIPLDTLPVDLLVKASTSVFGSHYSAVTWPFQPLIDGPGGLIPDLPLSLWRTFITSGRAANMSIITGFCSHEGTIMAPQGASTSAEFRSFFATLIPALSAADLDSLELLYPDPLIYADSPYRQAPGIGGPAKKPYGAQFRRIHEAFAHYAYICPVLYTAHALSRAGARVYVYEYAALGAPFTAASHGDHAPLVSHEIAQLIGDHAPGLAAVADAMNRRWTSFIASPGGTFDGAPDDAAWPAFQSPLDDAGMGIDGPGLGELLVFGGGNDEAAGGKSAGVAVRTRRLEERELLQCRFWWKRMELSEGMGEAGVASPFF